MDVSGQSMLPIAALGALMMPGALFKILGGVLMVFGVGVFALRWSTRRERARVYARPAVQPRPAVHNAAERSYRA